MFDIDLFAQPTVYNFLASKHHSSQEKKKKVIAKERYKEKKYRWKEIDDEL